MFCNSKNPNERILKSKIPNLKPQIPKPFEFGAWNLRLGAFPPVFSAFNFSKI